MRAGYLMVAGFAGAGLVGSPVLGQTLKDSVGYTALSSELGAGMLTGAGVPVAMTEGDYLVANSYLPNPADSQFAGKTFTNISATPGATTSAHATSVGQYFFGNTSGIAPGVTTVGVYQASNYIGAGFLKTPGFGNGYDPATETRKVQNHSWIGNSSGNAAVDLQLIQRLDYAIVRDGFTAAVGLNNGSGTTVPPFLAHSYNAISVGLTNGNHSRGGTTLEGVGRTKPDIVVPLTLTSYATPVVSGAAALLHQKVAATPALANGARPEVIKSLLMAGATKTEFGSWSRTQTRPLDSVFGAGELNVQRSYHILTGGEQESSTSSLKSLRGWDSSTISSTSKLYFFEVPQYQELSEFSVMLNWNRIVTDSQGGPTFTPASQLSDLNLRLYSASAFTLGSELDASLSTVDNLEHIYRTNLSAGQYALEVSSLSGSFTTNYGLSWYSGALSVVPEPGSLAILVMSGTLLMRRRTHAAA